MGGFEHKKKPQLNFFFLRYLLEYHAGFVSIVGKKKTKQFGCQLDKHLYYFFNQYFILIQFLFWFGFFPLLKINSDKPHRF